MISCVNLVRQEKSKLEKLSYKRSYSIVPNTDRSSPMKAKRPKTPKSDDENMDKYNKKENAADKGKLRFIKYNSI